MKKKIELKNNEKVYFASDFHLGAPDETTSKKRELRIVQWLDSIKNDAKAIILVGDLFDFWFEYKYVVPKGYIRFLGKLAELKDQGIEIVVFSGNHDLWMKDYLIKEIGVEIYHKPASFNIANKDVYIAHGDDLDPTDYKFKVIKSIFTNPICQFLFRLFHPDFGIRLANWWSSSSREELQSGHEDAYLIEHSKNVESKTHHDYYIYGDCHFDKEVKINNQSVYFNLGDWINKDSYLIMSSSSAKLKRWVKN